MGAAEYNRRRAQLLGDAAWNGYVARRGLNGEAGARARKVNQLQLLELRTMRKAAA